MRRLYQLFMRLVAPLLFAYLWLRGRQAPAYRRRWRERLALQKIPVQAREGLVIHCASVGEAVAARTLIQNILASYPHLGITVTTMTPTGSELIQQAFGKHVYHCYLPFDSGPAMRRFLDKLAPRALLLLETELWPNLLSECKRRRIPVGLLNARLSARSARGYAKLGDFGVDLWRCFSFIAAQTHATARRVRWLGALPDSVSVCGNLKQDYQPPQTLLDQASEWRTPLSERPVLVAGSTHPGEEGLVLAAFKQLLKDIPEALLILVPRHPERFAGVIQRVKDEGLSLALRSTREPIAHNVQVLMGDSMGELAMWYAAADAAFIGGSLIKRGGHNPVEAVAVNTPVLTGPHVFNFAEIYRTLSRRRAMKEVNDAAGLATGWRELLTHREAAQQQADRAQMALSADRGASERMLNLIRKYIPVAPSRQPSTIATTEMHKQQGQTIWFDPSQMQAVGPEHFSADYWRQRGAIAGNATGRNTAWFIDDGEQKILLRHYYRGGLVGKFNKDRFLRQPVVQSRAMREYALLLRLRELGLPVPEPVAASVSNAGFAFYRADIIVRIIPNATDIFQLLRQHALTEAEWQTLGQVIRRLHQAGVYHSDLNCHNLLLDKQGQAWIVDFDKCGFRAPGEWQDDNLNRLLRSLRKERGKHEDFHWSERDWKALLAGYQPEKTACCPE